MKAVILEGNSVNPGDISWEPVTSLCETTIYENTLDSEKWDRIAGHEVILINKVPMTREAMIVHFADNIDAKMKVMETFIEEDPSDGHWTAYNRFLNRNLYKPEKKEK